MQRGPTILVLVLVVCAVVGGALLLSRGGTGEAAPERGAEPAGVPAPEDAPEPVEPPIGDIPPPAAGIRGIVVDQEDRPIADARVGLAAQDAPDGPRRTDFRPGESFTTLDLMAQAQMRSGPRSHSVKTDEEGRFAFEPAGSGPFRLTVTKSGFGTKVLSDIRPSGADVVVVLLPGATIHGVVTSSEDGQPLEGARVGAGAASWTTGPEGRFSLVDVDAGTVTVRATMATYEPAKREMVLEPGGEETIALVLAPGSGILGTVLDPKGEPLPAARVRAVAGFASSHEALSDSKGRFALGGLGAAVYRVDARSSEYAPAVLKDVRLEEGQRITGLELRLRVGAAVEGAVRSASGAPVVGARVRVDPTADDEIPVQDAFARAFLDAARTAEDGSYRVGGLVEGSYTVAVVAPGHLPGRSDEFRVVEGETARIDLTLEVGLVIVGRVLDRSGRPVEGATVEQTQDMMRMAMTGGMRQEVPSTRSKADGTYVLGGLKGEVDLTAKAEGYASTTLKGVRPGEGEVDFVLGTLGSIAGRVLLDKPRQPIETFRVQAMSTTSGMIPGMGGFQPVGSVSNLGDGYFRVTGLEPGKYNLSVYSDAHAPGRRPGVEVGEGQESGGIEILLSPGETVSGVVVAAADGRPVAEADVSADMSGNMFLGMLGMGEKRAVKTAEDGSFTLAGLPKGTTNLRASHPDFAPQQLMNLRVPAESPLEIRLSGGGTVIVRVLTADRDPKAETMVILQRNMPFSQKIGTTDEAGKVVFERVPPGSYMVMEMNLGGLARRGLAGMDMKFTMAAVEDGETAEVELKSEGGATVRGRVMRGDQPVEGALVFLMSGTQTMQALEGMKFGATDDEGRYEIADVKPGEYTISISRQMGSAPQHSEKLVVGEGRDTTKDLELPLAEASGRVVDESGNGVVGVQVAAVPAHLVDFRTGDIDEAMSAYGAMVSSEDDGAFRLEGLSPGEYVIRAWKEGLSAAYSESFRVPKFGAGPTDVSVTLATGSEVTVKVRKPDGGPLGGAWVFATDSEGRMIPLTIQIATQTDSQGVAVLRLAPGDYRVEVQAVGHPVAFEAFSVEGGGTKVTVEVQEGGRLDVTVVGADGAGVPDVKVALLDEEGRSVGRRATQDFALDAGDLTRTDEQGALPFPLLAPGRYNVRARSDDGRKAEGAVTVTGGGSSELTLILE